MNPEQAIASGGRPARRSARRHNAKDSIPPSGGDENPFAVLAEGAAAGVPIQDGTLHIQPSAGSHSAVDPQDAAPAVAVQSGPAQNSNQEQNPQFTLQLNEAPAFLDSSIYASPLSSFASPPPSLISQALHPSASATVPCTINSAA